MLDASIRFQVSEKEWALTLPIDADWKTSTKRVLIILQSVDGRDLKAEGLLADKATRIAFESALEYSKQYARKLGANTKAKFAVVNHQSYRHLHLSGHAKLEAESDFRKRTLQCIEKLNPTHILFSGDLSLLYSVQNANNKNGWVHTIDKRLVTSTLDFARLLEKDGAQANLLGFWCRHLAFLLLGKNPFDVSHVKAKPTYINTIEKFDRVMRLWDKAKEAGVDTETRNLTVLHNAIYTIQFAFDSDPLRGFVLPIDHPHTANPFSLEDRKYIKQELRKRFGAKEGPMLVTMNGMFDLRIIRRALNLDVIYHTVWEVTAGEHLLDENISSMASIGIKMGGLAAIYCMYQNDHYLKEDTAFSKNDRNTTGNLDPADKGFLEYAATDVVSVLAIRQEQLKRAELEELDGKVYRPFFERHMLYQMSDTAHTLSHLRESGSMLDVKYLRSLMKADSPLVEAIKELQDEFKTIPQVQQANTELLADSGFKAGSLFGGKSGSQWLFSFTKPDHKIKLFLDVLGLKPLSKTKGGAPAIDKEFVEHYRDTNIIVSMFGEFQDASKILSTYVKGWYTRLRQELDGSDKHLRAEFEFFGVDTGRLASKKPNFQNIPSRGKLAKVIKEMFIAPDGHLLIRFDYSAHEVRGWSIVSGDIPLAEAFRAGQKLRQQLIKTPTDAVRQEMKKKGDLHIANVKRFFGKWVEKSDPLRDAVKSVVFGVLYGKSAATLGHDTKKAELGVIKAKIASAYKEKKPQDQAKYGKEFTRLLEEDRTDYAQGIIDKMFAEFQRGHQWVLKMQHMAENMYYVFSPIGRIRHLYAAMTKDRKIVSRQVRRGMNAPIQGFASEIAVKASRLTTTTYYRALPKLKKMLALDGRFSFRANRIVHDANYFTVPFEMVVPFIHILQWTSTYGVAQRYEEEFGLKFTVEPEIEVEVGCKDTKSYKWNWELNDLKKHLEQATQDGIDAGLYSESKEAILAKIFEPWRNKESLRFLDDNFPLLGVSLKKELYELARAT
jgi:DNA polymerase I-like protein with 3'-5' exonuclease and polymerase domains